MLVDTTDRHYCDLADPMRHIRHDCSHRIMRVVFRLAESLFINGVESAFLKRISRGVVSALYALIITNGLHFVQAIVMLREK